MAKWLNSAFILLAAAGLSACETAKGFGNRYGPDPAMPTGIVAVSVDHQIDIMAKLKQAALCSSGFEDTAVCYYKITLVGFNFVDEQCDAYLHELFAIEKERDRAKNAITSAGVLTNAILAVSPASKVTMAIVAQAFGLSTSYVDVATDSYLYKTDVGLIMNVVSELQAQYRSSVLQIYHDDQAQLASMPQAYGFIRGYLRLCMPPTIESKITAALAQSVAKPPKNPDAGNIQNIGLTSPKTQ